MSPPPHTSFPSDGKGPPWREMPVSGDFNISYRVLSEGAPPSPEAPSKEPLQTQLLTVTFKAKVGRSTEHGLNP